MENIGVIFRRGRARASYAKPLEKVIRELNVRIAKPSNPRIAITKKIRQDPVHRNRCYNQWKISGIQILKTVLQAILE